MIGIRIEWRSSRPRPWTSRCLHQTVAPFIILDEDNLGIDCMFIYLDAVQSIEQYYDGNGNSLL